MQGEQVAQHDQLEHSRRPRLALRLEPNDCLGRCADQLAGERDPPTLARVLVAIVQQQAGEAAARSRAVPALQLVVVGLGQCGREGRELRVLVQLTFPAVRDGSGQIAAVDHRGRLPDLVGEAHRSLRDRLAALLEMRCCGLDLRVDPGGGQREHGDLRGGAEHVGDGGARPQAGRQTDHRHPVPPGRLRQLATRGRDQPLRSQRFRRRVSGQRLLGVPRVAGAENG
jgi:hypothetical protein